MPTAYEMNKDEWRHFRPSEGSGWIRKGRDAEVKRKDEAMEIAGRASDLLKKEFGATRVVIFGSLIHDEFFNPWSDIDLAAWGISPDDFYAAVAAVTELSASFRIDLVDVNDCKLSVRQAIEREGLEI